LTRKPRRVPAGKVTWCAPCARAASRANPKVRYRSWRRRWSDPCSCTPFDRPFHARVCSANARGWRIHAGRLGKFPKRGNQVTRIPLRLAAFCRGRKAPRPLQPSQARSHDICPMRRQPDGRNLRLSDHAGVHPPECLQIFLETPADRAAAQVRSIINWPARSRRPMRARRSLRLVEKTHGEGLFARPCHSCVCQDAWETLSVMATSS
jgi:hypothetical protein